MKKVNFISREDWEQMAARLENSCNTALDSYVTLANSLGKSHPCTKKSLMAYNRISRLKSDMRHLAKEFAGEIFREKELDNLFPDTDTSRKKGCVYHGWKI